MLLGWGSVAYGLLLWREYKGLAQSITVGRPATNYQSSPALTHDENSPGNDDDYGDENDDECDSITKMKVMTACDGRE